MGGSGGGRGEGDAGKSKTASAALDRLEAFRRMREEKIERMGWSETYF